MASISTTSVAEESSQLGELQEDLPYTSPQHGKISEFDILTLSILIYIIVMTTSDFTMTQVEEPIMGTGAKDIPVEVLTEKVLTVEPILKVATNEIITAPDPEAHVVISKMRQILTQPASALLGVTSVPPSTSESVSIVIVETRSGGTPPVLIPALDILEELTVQMVKQFFTTMKY